MAQGSYWGRLGPAGPHRLPDTQAPWRPGDRLEAGVTADTPPPGVGCSRSAVCAWRVPFISSRNRCSACCLKHSYTSGQVQLPRLSAPVGTLFSARSQAMDPCLAEQSILAGNRGTQRPHTGFPAHLSSSLGSGSSLHVPLWPPEQVPPPTHSLPRGSRPSAGGITFSAASFTLPPCSPLS